MITILERGVKKKYNVRGISQGEFDRLEFVEVINGSIIHCRRKRPEWL